MTELPLARKSLGQHWLSDKLTLKSIADTAELNNADTVLEIGPGSGTLTVELLKRAGQVIAVELDEKLAKGLSRQLPNPKLRIVQQDILTFDLNSLPLGYKLVANIPYYLTGHLLRLLSESTNPPSVAVLLIQKEVAQRVTAQPGQMSLLSVTTQFYWEVKTGQMVPAKLFTPPPKVDSQVLKLVWRAEPLFRVNAKEFFRLVKAGFANRRKTLLNSLSSGLQLEKEQVRGVLKSVGLAFSARPQELSLQEWHDLFQAIAK